MTPCNSCDNGSCGSCVAENLECAGFIRSAKDHCGCAENGHNNTTELTRPKVKSMLGKQKVERDIPVNKEISVEEEVELEVD